MKAHELKRGMIIQHPTRSYECLVTIANVKPGHFKSSLVITFTGGMVAHVPRDTEIYVFETPTNQETRG